MPPNDHKKLEILIARAWIIFIMVLFVILIAETLVDFHPVFGPEKIPFFHAWFGFAACALIVLVSKFLGHFLKRPEDYYEENE